MQQLAGLIDDVISLALYEQQRDYLKMHRNRYIYTLEVLFSLLPAKKFIDVGSSGLFQYLIKELSPFTDVCGTQYSSEAGVKVEAADFKGIGEFRYYLGNPESFCYAIESGSFDLVLCAEVIEHMSVDPMALLAEMNRIMRLDARMVITTPNIVSCRSLLQALNHEMPYNFYAFNRNRSTDRHNIEYSPDLLRRIVEAAGFEVEKLSTVNCWSAPDVRVEAFLGKNGFRQDLRGDDIVLVARKKEGVRDRYPDFLYLQN
ncbi:class I SAM-dependent methyltransferase [Diaphorobacter nitroreducens]|uniref:class I SAM-dependent methyltransferase n=1 Tax=Diaphorobacter nitroreducens TaxID=164759 RepID=UPI0028A10E63|nr:methyltransferase domain-containing protein [Diaphorobacter nitroreducens]